MEMQLGGPVWHASIHYHGNARSHDVALHHAKLLRALWRVGNIELGQWWQDGYDGNTIHLRRRLTLLEWQDKPWGMDLRQTPEGDARLVAAGCPRSIGLDEYTP